MVDFAEVRAELEAGVWWDNLTPEQRRFFIMHMYAAACEAERKGMDIFGDNDDKV
jgi:hypothetical protein